MQSNVKTDREIIDILSINIKVISALHVLQLNWGLGISNQHQQAILAVRQAFNVGSAPGAQYGASWSSMVLWTRSVGPSITLSEFHSASITERPKRLETYLVRVMRGKEPGVFGGLNASWVVLYGGNNAQQCMMAAVLFENIYKVMEARGEVVNSARRSLGGKEKGGAKGGRGAHMHMRGPTFSPR